MSQNPMFLICNVPLSLSLSLVCVHTCTYTRTHAHIADIRFLLHTLFVPLLQAHHSLLLLDHVLALLGSGKLVAILTGRKVLVSLSLKERAVSYSPTSLSLAQCLARSRCQYIIVG